MNDWAVQPRNTEWMPNLMSSFVGMKQVAAGDAAGLIMNDLTMSSERTWHHMITV